MFFLQGKKPNFTLLCISTYSGACLWHWCRTSPRLIVCHFYSTQEVLYDEKSSCDNSRFRNEGTVLPRNGSRQNVICNLVVVAMRQSLLLWKTPIYSLAHREITIPRFTHACRLSSILCQITEKMHHCEQLLNELRAKLTYQLFLQHPVQLLRVWSFFDLALLTIDCIKGWHWWRNLR